jgi:DNA-binding winged helix-turn-helix (wHTH) protein
VTAGTYRFDRFELDSADRRLLRDGQPVELSSRYLDALVLMLREPGRLVSKDRFLDEVWRGVPVTDEALTQCIKTLRRLLGDEAARPRFIETVPKHGYRFIAPVDGKAAAVRAGVDRAWRDALLLGAAGTIGGGMAGFVGGLIYGFAAASDPVQPGV